MLSEDTLAGLRELATKDGYLTLKAVLQHIDEQAATIAKLKAELQPHRIAEIGQILCDMD